MDVPRRVQDWAIEREIARGGMGAVFRVAHADGRIGALKWLEAATPLTLGAFREEVRALERLRHPQVVRVLDHGELGGRPWLVLELVEGRSVRELFGPPGRRTSTSVPTIQLDLPSAAPQSVAAPREPPPLPIAALSAVRAVCEPLAFLHGEGLVHGDLKPENILLRPDGSPVLIDFGLARARREREVLEPRRTRAGTARYMAPELIRGERVDGRADLYALGCMLYEILAGAPPFDGTSSGILEGHLHEAPLPPGLPPELADLERLVLALLAKSPRDRPGWAAEVGEQLERHGAAPVRGTAVRPSLFHPGFFGRDEQLGPLLRLVEEGTGAAVITGPAGSGRTRLLAEVGERARKSRLIPLRGGVREFAGLLRERAPHAVGPDRAPTASTWTEIADALVEEGPAILLIDDLHRSDESAAAFVAWLGASRIPGLAAVATADLEEAGDLLRSTCASPSVLAVPLGPLDRAAATRLLADVLGEDGDAAARLARAASPADLVDLVRTAVEREELVRSGGSWRLDPAALARTPREALALRAAAIAAVDVLAAAALVGPRVDVEILGALGYAEEDVWAALSEAERVGVLDGAPLAFASERLRAGVVDALPAERRAATERRILEVEAVSTLTRAAIAQRCGDPRAAKLLYAAATALAAEGSAASALACLRAGLGLRPGIPLALDLARKAIVLQLNAEPAEAEAIGLVAREQAAAADLRDEEVVFLRFLAVARSHQGDAAGAAAYTARALERVGPTPSVLRSTVLIDLAAAEIGQGRTERAGELLREILAPGAPELPDYSRMLAEVDLALVDLNQGRADPALARMRRVVDGIAEDEPDRAILRLAAASWVNIGAASLALGRPTDARNALRHGLELARRSRSHRQAVVALCNLAEMDAEAGDLPSARRGWDEALDLARRGGMPGAVAAVQITRFEGERRAGGSPDPSWIDDAEAAFARADDRLHLVHVACERGHLAILRGEDPGPWLAEARARAALVPESLPALARLERAVAAGDRCVNGDAPEDAPR